MRAGLSGAESKLFDACAADDLETVEALLDQGVNPSATNALGWGALHVLGFQNGKLAALLLRFLSPVQSTLTSTTVLHIAAEKGSPEVLSLFLEAVGSDSDQTLIRAAVDARDDSDRTPLDFAAERGDVVVCQMLLSHGASPDAQASGSGLTPFLTAAKAGHTDVVELLAEHCDPSVCDRNARNVLHLAVIGRHVSVCELLVADVDLVTELDAFGKSPLDYVTDSAVRKVFENLIIKPELKETISDEKNVSLAENNATNVSSNVSGDSLTSNNKPRMQMKMFQDEVMDFSGVSGVSVGELEMQVNQFLAIVGNRGKLISQSLSCVSIPSSDSKKPGRIKRYLSIVIEIE